MAAGEHVKLRMKIGIHEFEAEGARDLVMAQLDVWTRLAGLPATAAAGDGARIDGDPALARLFAVDAEQQLITLRATLAGRRRNADAAVLLLHAYEQYLGADGRKDVPAAGLRAALAASGYRPKRLDRALTSHLTAGLIRKTGAHRHKAYGLTVQGSRHAAALLRRLTR